MKKLMYFSAITLLSGISVSNITAFCGVTQTSNSINVQHHQNQYLPKYKYQLLKRSLFNNYQEYDTIKTFNNGHDAYVPAGYYIVHIQLQSDGTFKKVGTIPTNLIGGGVTGLDCTPDGKLIFVTTAGAGSTVIKVVRPHQYEYSIIEGMAPPDMNLTISYTDNGNTIYIGTSTGELFIGHLQPNHTKYVLDKYPASVFIPEGNGSTRLTVGQDGTLYIAANNYNLTKGYFFISKPDSQGRYTFSNPKIFTEAIIYPGVSTDQKIITLTQMVHRTARVTDFVAWIGILQNDGTYQYHKPQFSVYDPQSKTANISADGKTIITQHNNWRKGNMFLLGYQKDDEIGYYAWQEIVVPHLAQTDELTAIGVSTNGQYFFAGTSQGIIVGSRIN